MSLVGAIIKLIPKSSHAHEEVLHYGDRAEIIHTTSNPAIVKVRRLGSLFSVTHSLNYLCSRDYGVIFESSPKNIPTEKIEYHI